MINVALVVVLLGLVLLRNKLDHGSLAAGVLLGLVLMSTQLGAPMADAAQSATTAIGQGVMDVFASVGDGLGG
ncbi:MAG: hypothetical protein GEV09_09735 [Pseudonocardiaceae bacterium]|nr:hypothetical protein [Pseudonocardiaceae bacterium]